MYIFPGSCLVRVMTPASLQSLLCSQLQQQAFPTPPHNTGHHKRLAFTSWMTSTKSVVYKTETNTISGCHCIAAEVVVVLRHVESAL